MNVVPAGADDASLLAVQAATRFVTDAAGRVLYENAPDHSSAPRLHLAGCATSNIVRIRHDVGAAAAQALEHLAASEPPLVNPDVPPIHLAEYHHILAAEAPVKSRQGGLSWIFPVGLEYVHRVPLVASDTPQGQSLLLDVQRRGPPPPLVELGFVDAGELWPPWCIALTEPDGEIASIVISARWGPAGAEAGVATVPALRGRGFAGAATAGWAALPAMRGRLLFYSTSSSNLASRQVARRLNLRLIGATFAIT